MSLAGGWNFWSVNLSIFAWFISFGKFVDKIGICFMVILILEVKI